MSSSPEQAGPLPRFFARFWHLWAVGFFTLLTLIQTWPLALNLNKMAGGMGDNIYFVFLIRWYASVLTHPGTPLFQIPWLNYPHGWSLASTDTALSATLPGIPFALLWGDAAGFNVAMLFTFIFSGWAMAAWVRHLTGSGPAGLFAGTLYAFLPYHMAHYMIGHLNLSSMQWFPLFFWGLYDLLRARAWSWKPAVLAGLSLGMIALLGMYYLYITLTIAVVFVLAYLLLANGRTALLGRVFWLNALTAGLSALPLTALAVFPYLDYTRSGGIASRSVEYAAQNSASPTDFFLPFPGGLLWSRWMESTYLGERWVEQSLGIGFIGLIMALAAWFLVRSEQRRLLRLAALCAAASFILALGVHLNWLGQPVLVNGLPLPLPGLLLFNYAPFFDKMRALARFGVFVPFFTTLAAGLGAATLFDLLKTPPLLGGSRRWLTAPALVVLVILTFLEFAVHPGTNFTSIGPRPVDLWLADQPGKGAVAIFPFKRESDQDMVYYALYFKKPYIGGFYSANFPDQYWQIQPALETFPSLTALDQLRDLGVAYILIDKKEYPDLGELTAACQDLGMPLLVDFVDTSVYTLPPR